MSHHPTPVTRFPPSPTGMLHIGSARTALFNWLFARHAGGTFLLRIEDTDKERSTDEAKAAILEGMSWLELNWDGDVVYQSERSERHKEVGQQLLNRGLAYRCYCTPEELAAMREKARAEGRPIRYDGTWRNRDPADAPAGVEPVLRLRAQQDGQTVIKDHVQGDVQFSNDTLDDLILLRSDGSPTYMLSVVVDDHDMGVTHIIRGDDHLTNAARQTQIFAALEWQVPEFAHIPLIHGPDGKKLSKRHGALAVSAYRDMGYLPEAMRNYLLRLGWSHGDDEIISTDQAVEWFNLEAIGRGPARFDYDKLNHLNNHYIRLADIDTLADRVISIMMQRTNIVLDDALKARIVSAIPSFRERAKTLVDLAESCVFLVARRPLDTNEKAKKVLTEESRQILGRLGPLLSATEDWTENGLKSLLNDFAVQNDVKFGKIAQPLRAALTGGVESPGILDILVILGRDEALGRIADQSLTA